MSKKIKQIVGIVGLGTVGGALKKYFDDHFRNIAIFDKYKKIGSIEEIKKSSIIFLCLPTSFKSFKVKKWQEVYNLKDIIEILKNLNNGQIVILKSTVLPGTTEYLQKKFPKIILLHNPEFLRQKFAFKDFINPDFQILGYCNKKGERVAKKIINILPKAPFTQITKARNAEVIKLSINSFLALKVCWANSIYDYCFKIKTDYKEIKKGITADKRIGSSHLEVFYEGYRGFGGSCLLKDINAIITHAKILGIDMKILKSAKR